MKRLIDSKDLVNNIYCLACGEKDISVKFLADYIDKQPIITEQEIAKPLFDEFKKKLSKWMYNNSESVCGDSMIDIDYLEGHIDEILYEMGIIGEVENVSD